jgi:hypothetical protein
VSAADAADDEDLQSALFTCYELHYQGWDEVDEGWEWNPSLLALRARLEETFESGLRDLVGEREPVAAAHRVVGPRGAGGRRRPCAGCDGIGIPSA